MPLDVMMRDAVRVVMGVSWDVLMRTFIASLLSLTVFVVTALEHQQRIYLVVKQSYGAS